MAATAYNLPYSVHHTPAPFMGVGQDISVTVVFADSASGEAIADAWSLLVAFLHLAKSGALSGATITPWTSGIQSIEERQRSDTSATWVLRSVVIDDLSVAVLAQVFLITHRNYPLTRILIHDASTTDQLVQLRRSENGDGVYPQLFAPMSARVTISPHHGEDINVEAQLSGELSDEEIKVVRSHLENCIAAIAVGCYPIAPLSPADCGVQYDRTIRFFEEWIEFGLAGFAGHPDALYGLCNALISALGQHREILAVEIE